jgi:Haem-NO-binding
MHGMVNRGIQCFVRDIYGQPRWEEVCSRAGLPFFNFESMLVYEDKMTEKVLGTLGQVLGLSRAEILEDFGTYVVSDAHLSSVRRLLRLGGDTFEEFLHSLDDVHDRAKIAMPDLDVPRLTLEPHSESEFTLHYKFSKLGYGGVFLGLLRAMADDYGALVLIDHFPQRLGRVDKDHFSIRLLHLNWSATAAAMTATL